MKAGLMLTKPELFIFVSHRLQQNYLDGAEVQRSQFFRIFPVFLPVIIIIFYQNVNSSSQLLGLEA